MLKSDTNSEFTQPPELDPVVDPTVVVSTVVEPPVVVSTVVEPPVVVSTVVVPPVVTSGHCPHVF